MGQVRLKKIIVILAICLPAFIANPIHTRQAISSQMQANPLSSDPKLPPIYLNVIIVPVVHGTEGALDGDNMKSRMGFQQQTPAPGLLPTNPPTPCPSNYFLHPETEMCYPKNTKGIPTRRSRGRNGRSRVLNGGG